MKQHNYYFRHSIAPFLVLWLMMSAAILRGQTQYIGASGGDWSTATNWNNGLPSATNLPTITGDGNVCINGTLTIDYLVTNFGAIINKGTVTLTGSISSGGTLENQGSFDINLGASMTSGGGFTNSGTLNNKGNVISNSAFVNTGSGFFNNTATWAQYGTFLNDGVFGNNAGSFTCTSDFTNNSIVENGSAATWKMDFGSSFTNNVGSTLTNLGSFQNIGTFTNNTTVTNSGLFTNNATHNCNGIFNNESGGQLVSTATVNMAGRLNNKVGASVTSSNIFNILANGYVSNLGQFTNSNMIDIKDTGTFCVETGATLTGNYGSTITNAGYFKVALSATVTTNGTITNNGKADIYGLYDAMNGGNIFNTSLLCSYGSVKNVNVIDNSGVWKNLGIMENNSGGVWTNTGTVDNFKGATISNNYEIRNKPTGIINNNGTFNNNIRLYNEGLFTNNAYFVSSGAILNLVGGTFLNTEVLVIREGSIQNAGILTNEKTTINEPCSTISNTGTINNAGRFENKGILFQRGTVSGNAILQLSGYVHTATGSNAPAICKTSLITGTDVNCDAKVYGQSGFLTTLDIGECNGFQYTANGVARYLYHAIHIGTPQTTHFKIITQTGDSLTCDVPTTVFDNVSPVVNNCPRDATIYTNQNTATYSWPPVTGVDNCGDTPSVTSSTASGSAFPIGTTKVTVSVKDSRSNTTDCVFNVNIIKVTTTATCPATDVAAPVFANCPTNQTITSSNTAAAVVWNAPSVTDNCYPVLVQQNFNSGTFFPIGTHTVTYTAKDPTGNIGTCSFTVTVNGPADICTTDNIKPIIVNCPPNFFGTLNPAITGAVGYWKTPTATDNCGGAVALTGTAVSGTIFNVGTTNVIYTATDVKNNTSTCSFTVSIEGTNPCPGDITGPALTCPANITVNTTNLTAPATWTTPTPTDACSPVTLNGSHQSGNIFAIGTTTVTYCASDKLGNTSKCTFNVNVVNPCLSDTIAPKLTACPANKTIVTAGTTATATWTAPTATDNCTLAGVTSNFASGVSLPVGTTDVVYTATDIKGNKSTCSFSVIVTQDACLGDVTPPVFVSNCLTSKSAVSTTGACMTISLATPTATDNCGTPTITASHASNFCFPVGTTTFTYTATDTKGNKATCSFPVTITYDPCFGDATAPSFGTTCPTSQTLTTTASVCKAATWVAPTVTDNCGTPTVSSSHASGFCFPVGTTVVTYTATDTKLNKSTCSFTVTVQNASILSPPVVVSASRYCTGSVTLTASGCTGGTIYWYDEAGTTQLGTGSSFTTPNLTTTTRYRVLCNVNNVWSAAAYGTATITIPSPPTATSASRTGAGTVTLTASGCTGGTIYWYDDVAGGPSVGSGTTFTTPYLTATNNYSVYCYTNGCWSSSTHVTATINNTTPVSCTGNLLSNFSFESDLTRYDNWGATVITTNANSGSKAAIVGTAAGGFGQDVVAVPYATYTFKSWNKIAGTVSWAGYGIDCYDASWNQISSTNRSVTATSFTEGSISVVAPANTAYIIAWVWKDGTTGTMTTDDWCLTSVAAPTCAAISTTKTYRLVNKLSGKVLGLEGLNTADNTYINQYTYNTTPNMQWQFSLNADGSYKVINRYSNDILACHSTTSGARVYQWQNINDNAKYWVLENKGNCEYRLKNVYSGKYLDNISNGSTEGGQIGIALASGGADQLWRIEEVTAAPNCFSAGSIAIDRWSGVNWAFPIQLPTTTPTLSTTQGNTQGPWNVADNYMSRARGYICPQQTGSYQFNVTGDDNVELFLSTNSMAGSMTRIAYINGWTNELEYSKYASQTSSTITLQANQIYYFELRHAEGSGGDGWRISWKTPSTTAWQPIPSQFLARSCNTTYKSASQAVFEFSAKADNRVAKLQWISNGGLNNDFYAVEKADEAGAFQHLSTINAATGNDAPTIFDYTDESPSEGDNHYRIKTVDNNGPPQYSAVKTINFKNIADAKVYPNPANDVLNIDLKSFEGLRVDIQLFDAMGKMITVSHVDKATATSYQVSTSEMPVGSYLVRIMPEGKREVTKQVKIAR